MRLIPACAALLLVSASLSAGDWPGWRGPRGDGVSDEKAVPLTWGQTENVAWKTPIPGRGHSSPVVCAGRVFLTTCLEKEEKRDLLCLDRRDGKVLWQQTVVTAKLEEKHKNNGHASSTPVADDKHVWVTFLAEPDMVVACYDHDGKQVWKASPGRYVSKHGFCGSPVLHKDLLIVNGDQDEESFIVALDKLTGKERWRTARPNNVRSFSVPLLIDVGGKKQLALSGSKGVAAYDPDTGKQLWFVETTTDKFVATVVHGEGVLFATGTSPEHTLIALRPTADGGKPEVVWRDNKGGAYVPSPIVRGGLLFMVTDGGVATCVEIKTGKKLWSERLGTHHVASPVLVGEHLFFPDDTGETWVIKASEKFELVARNTLEEECTASPAVSKAQLFLRTAGHLYCVGTPAGRK